MWARLIENINGRRTAHTAGAPAIGALTPMTHEVSHGAATREPVYSGTRRVRGLWQRKRADGSTVYEARLRLDGRDTTIVLEATHKSDAIREQEALRVDRNRGEQRHRSVTPTLDELAAEWIDHLQSRVAIRDERRRYSERTVELYRQRLRDHVLDRLGRRNADDITADDVRHLVDRLTRHGLAPGTITSCVNILSGLLRYGLKRNVVAHNIVRDLDRDDRPGAKRQSEPRYLTVGELERLLAKMSETFRPVAAACVYAGLRVSEALGLRWRDIDLTAGTISVAGQLGAAGARLTTTKTSASAATVPLLPALRRELVAHRTRQARVNLALVHADALVFTTSRGKPQSRRNALRAVHVAGDNAELNGDGFEPVGLHDLRHSLVAIAFEVGLSAPEVAVLARHANPNVTLAIYAGLSGDGRDRAFAKLSAGGFGA
jgi:integrase